MHFILHHSLSLWFNLYRNLDSAFVLVRAYAPQIAFIYPSLTHSFTWYNYFSLSHLDQVNSSLGLLQIYQHLWHN